MVYRPMNLPQNMQAQYMRDPRMSLSNRLTLQGLSTEPVQHWAQGLGRLAQALAGTYIGNKVDNEYRERGDKYAADLNSLFAPVTMDATEMDPQGGSRPATYAEMLSRGQGTRNADLGPILQSLALQSAGEASEESRFNRRANMEDQRWQDRFGMQDAQRQRERGEDRTWQEKLARLQIDSRQPNLVAVMGPNGQPQYVQSSNAVGMTPYDATAARQATFSTLTPQEVAAAGLPPGSSVQRNNQTQQLSILNKPATAGTVIGYTAEGEPITAPGVKAMTEGQANAALYADRMEAANEIIRQITSPNEEEIKGGAKAYMPGLMDSQVTSSALGNYLLPGAYPPETVKKMQRIDQAQRDFINAVLRRESGAVISPEEFTNARIQYFPRAGDSPEVLQQKAQNRQIALEGISRAAGPAYEEIKRRKKPAGNNGWSIQKVQ